MKVFKNILRGLRSYLYKADANGNTLIINTLQYQQNYHSTDYEQVLFNVDMLFINIISSVNGIAFSLRSNRQIMLILNGRDTGQAVYIDQDLGQPSTVKKYFLEWYEKWLDKILA